jgi:ATP-dependent DNA helicase RecQ
MISKKHDYNVDEEEEETTTQPISGGIAYDEALYHILKSVRKKVAKDKSLPPYVIFQDPSLEEMATTYPTSMEELSNVNGVGRGKVEKFGQPFVKAIKKYVEDNDITTAADVVVKSAGNKSKVKIFIIQQIDRKIELDEIAESKGLSFDELLNEMEQICYSGTKLNIDYCIDQYIDEERREEIFDYFLSAESDSLIEAMEEFEDLGYEEEDLRLMRIKFLSEYAN